MAENKSKEEEESAQNVGPSLFTTAKTDDVNDGDGNTTKSNEEMISFAEQFVDKIRAIHEHFDKNKDGYLNYDELSSLQLCTSGQTLDSTMYGYLCQGLGCQPDKGLSLDGLKLTYASEGTLSLW